MRKTDIIYIEDNEDFSEIVERAFTQVNDQAQLTIIDDGKTALQKIEAMAEAQHKPRLILLDMNLPGVSGLDVLRKIKETMALRCVPVVMFTTSDNPKDIRNSLDNGANAYVTKPLGYLNLVNCLKSVNDFWINTATCA
ncbi:response regulator [Mucilaginibacter koreensis]